MALVFSTFAGFQQFLTGRIHKTVFSGVGISNRRDGTTVLRLVEHTPYYADEVAGDGSEIRYTLFGKIGDQDPNETRFNGPFLEPGRRIFVYKVIGKGSAKTWTWMGEYSMDRDMAGQALLEDLVHPDEMGSSRTIYRVTLHRLAF